MRSVSRRRFLAAAAAWRRRPRPVSAPPAACGDDGDAAGRRGRGAGGRPATCRSGARTRPASPIPANEQGLLAAFTVTAADRGELRETFAALTAEIDRLMSGEPYEERDPAYPPLHTGTVGNPPPPADLSVVVSVGASLFDDRYGLADRRRRSSRRCRSWPTTGSTPPARTATCCSPSPAPTRTSTCSPCASSPGHPGHAGAALDARRLQPPHRGPPGEAGVRNLMGFIDGTANLDPDDER